MVVLAAPALIVSALFALLFMLAWHQWRGVIINTLSTDIPIIGNVIAQAVANALDLTYSVVAPWLDGALSPLANFLIGPIQRLNAFEQVVTGGFTRVKSYVDNLAFVTIPQYAVGTVNIALNYAAAVLDEAERYADSIYGGIFQDVLNLEYYFAQDVGTTTTYIDTQIASLRTQLLAEIGTAVVDTAGITTLIQQYVTSGVNAAEAFTQQAYDAATSYAGSLAVTAEQDIAKAITTAETYAATTAAAAATAIVTDLDTAITGALTGIYTDLDIAIDDVTTLIGTGDADILAGLKAIPRVIPGDIAGLSVLAGSTALALTRYLKECGIPNCKNLTGLGNEIQSILGLVGDASFLALLVALVHDPEGASRVVEDTFGDAITAFTATGRALLGV